MSTASDLISPICRIISEYIPDPVKKLAYGHYLDYQDVFKLFDLGFYKHAIDHLVLTKRTKCLTLYVAKFATLDELKRLRKQGYAFNEETFSGAASNKNEKTAMQMVKWLYSIKCPYDEYVVTNALSRKKPLPMTKWLMKRRFPHNNSIFVACKANPRYVLPTLIWLHENEFKIDVNMVDQATLIKDEKVAYKVLAWLLDNGCEPSSRTFRNAATNDTLPLYVLKWLHENKFPYDDHTIACVAHRKNQTEAIEIMEWMLENKFPCSPFSYQEAVGHGKMEILEWLYSKNFPRDSDAFNRAVVHNEDLSLKIIRWLYVRLFPYNKRVYINAAKCNQLKVLQWLYDQELPYPADMMNEISSYALTIDTIRWLINHNIIDADKVIPALARRNNIAVIDDLVRRGGFIYDKDLLLLFELSDETRRWIEDEL